MKTGASNPKGRYWDRAWSLVDGCTPCSPGCENCWSAAMRHRFHGQDRYLEGKLTDEHGHFNGITISRGQRLDIPLKTRKPTVWAVWNDLFHLAVPFKFVDETYKIINYRLDHTFLVLTKRPERARLYYQSRAHWEDQPNLWLGVTVCNQREADEKIPLLLQTPAAHRWISIEPMLGAIDINKSIDVFVGEGYGVESRQEWVESALHTFAVILGGETGAKARPMHPDWVRSVRDQCAAAGVPFFFKQWGEWAPSPDGGLPDNLPSSAGFYFQHPDPPGKVWKFGRNKAGRIFDGRTHDELPWRTL